MDILNILKAWVNNAGEGQQRAFNVRMMNGDAELSVDLYDSEKGIGIVIFESEFIAEDLDSSAKWAESYQQVITQAQSQVDYYTDLMNG